MLQCRICNNNYEPFISFGKMPIANGFLKPEEFGKEYFFELATGFCPKCKMVQIVEQPNREMMFHENYAFFSSTSSFMKQHFKEFADLAMKDIGKKPKPFVMEIGSNDGIMLGNFAKAKIHHLGIEPSANVAKVAIENGVNTISEFFDAELAKKIMREHGQADAIIAANVMCHIPTIHSVVEGYKILLKPDGIIMFEDPYLGEIIENTLYDQIYDEHVFLFSVASIGYLFGEHSLEIVDVMPQTTHGGSMRYVIAHKGARKISQRVFEQQEKEKKLGLNMPQTYVKFRKNVENSRDQLVRLLKDVKRQGKRVVGYAATSKSTTINNYCGITSELVEYISDTTPIKQGRFSPGTHIPIKPYQDFKNSYPEYALLYAYNHAKEIMAKEQDFMAKGGKWITYVPKVGVQG